MTTINDVVREGYRALNVVGETASLKPGQLANGISLLNRLIDGWNVEKLLPVTNQFETFSLVVSQQSYTIGSGGNFNTTRPLEILKATIDVSNSTYPMEPYTAWDWMDIFNKTNESNIPRIYYYEPAYPLGKIYLHYVPSATNTINLLSKKQLGQYVIDDTISLAPGYERMFIYNLAQELLLTYPSESLGPMIIKIASDSIEDVRRGNTKNILREADLDIHAYSGNKNRGFLQE